MGLWPSIYTVSPFCGTLLVDVLLTERLGSEHTIDALSATLTLDMSTALLPAAQHIIHSNSTSFTLHNDCWSVSTNRPVM
jgi:hypothetical protein